ncbi:hypothetical protein EHW67_08855 [Arenibacter aquaticus]|uniref:ASPIC/UnbV domain-containing protein n=1 Tax=Arenibacter aquaticus TaxID=2489054 RepID=A0A430K4I3_9FLAO|nr:VCBS repeat-containing protein [Arenibacter aquaticus]RTE54027.1 hypothetical protein EHW67_08855 [Arenibacter aquaticus]
MKKKVITSGFRSPSKSYKLSMVLVVILMAIFIMACEEKGKTPKVGVDQGLFQSIPPKSTAITFANNVKATNDFNLFAYMYFYNGGGVAAGDLNGDGLDDLYFTGNQVQNKLYLNQGEFHFKDITAITNTGGKENSWYTGVIFADVNGDGRLDIYVGQIGDILGSNDHNLLFINLGNDADGYPQFKESAQEMGLIVDGATTHSAFFDYDLDGDLDVYVMTHSNFNDGVLPKAEQRLLYSPKGDKLFRNDGNSFTDVTKQAGIYSSTLGFGLGINTADVNKDGYPDIYVGNDFYEDDYLYINNGDGTFSEKLSNFIKHTSRFSMGNDIVDMNNDGLPDILSLDMQPYDPKIIKASHGEDSYPIYNYKLSFGYKHQYAHNTFQLNRDGKHFSEIARLAGIEATDWSWSVLGNDFDLDGFKDIFITNGIYKRSNDMDYMQFLSGEAIQQQLRAGNYDYSKALVDKMPSYPLQNFFYKNNKDLTFSNVSTAWGGSKKGFSNGATYTDLDNDGDMDLVVNNLNERASILKNTSIEQSVGKANFLRVSLKGLENNPFGIGTKVTLKYSGKTLYQELLTSRGYLSSVPPYLNFGIPDNSMIDTILIEWPNQTHQVMTNVKPGRTVTINQLNTSRSLVPPNQIANTIFAKVESELMGVSFQHKENRFYEFNREHLIPHINSTWGAPLAVADINQDGLDDFFVGGAQNQIAKVYLQNTSGKFIEKAQAAFEADAISEDTAAHFFDADKDGDMDLLVGSGSNQEIRPEVKSLTRLYLNNGMGTFTKQINFPKIYGTVSCLALTDFDKDADKDIFIGCRTVPGKYGSPANSYLLVNDGKGNFSLSANSKKLFDKCGMVTAANWVDLNGDSWEELVLAGEWMPIKIYNNKKGELQNAEPKANKLELSNGWWNSLEYGDFDKDGDVDLVAGNLGLNAKLRASSLNPVRMYHNDFDKNGWPEGITTHYIDGQEHVFSSKSLLEKQLLYLRKKFTTYAAFSNADFNEIFTKEQLNNSLILEAYEFRSCYFENVGNNEFNIVPLPQEAQFSLVNDIFKLDFDQDGHIDLLLGQNLHDVNTELGRYDAGYGSLLKNMGNDIFHPIPLGNSGLKLDNQVREIEKIHNKKYGDMLIISNNNTGLDFYRVTDGRDF